MNSVLRALLSPTECMSFSPLIFSIGYYIIFKKEKVPSL